MKLPEFTYIVYHQFGSFSFVETLEDAAESAKAQHFADLDFIVEMTEREVDGSSFCVTDVTEEVRNLLAQEGDEE